MNVTTIRVFRLSCILLLAGCVALEVSAQNADSDITAHYTRMMVYHRYMDGSVPDGAVLFIGDSITQGLCVAAVCDKAVNYGIGSDTTLGVLERLKDYSSMERAAAVVVAIGVNDLGKRDNEAILANYKKIIEAVPSDTPLLFSAVLPLDERVKQVKEDRNIRIRALNESLAALCADNPRVHVVECTPLLADGTGNLNPAYHVGDGVHLNTEGYARWITVLREKLSSISTP